MTDKNDVALGDLEMFMLIYILARKRRAYGKMPSVILALKHVKALFDSEKTTYNRTSSPDLANFCGRLDSVSMRNSKKLCRTDIPSRREFGGCLLYSYTVVLVNTL